MSLPGRPKGEEHRGAQHEATPMSKRLPKPSRPPRGSATLVVILMLAFLGLLLMAAAHRSLLTEQRSAANLYRAAQAFEAAEAGLEWTLARLNSGAAIDDRCSEQPDGLGGTSFRERFAPLPPTPLRSAPDAPLPPSPPTAEEAAPGCQRAGTGWACQCPMSPATPLDPSPQTASGPFFAVVLQNQRAPGLVDVMSTGCVGDITSTPCHPSRPPGGTLADARAGVQVTLGHIPGLAVDPAAALTVRGSIDLGDAPWVLGAGTPTARRLALHAGGALHATALTVLGAAGSPLAALQLDGDPNLRDQPAEAQFLTLFRMDKPAWRRQPAVRRIDCAAGCSTALQAAIGPGMQHPMVWLDNGLTIDRPVTLGSASHPVLLMVDGPIRFDAPALIHGLVYGTSSAWNDNAGATVRGAVVLEGDLHGRGGTRIEHDAAVLKRLSERAGTFARVAGSWRDF
jgi:hypothetical protein